MDKYTMWLNLSENGVHWVCGTNPGLNPPEQSSASLCGRRNSPLDWSGWQPWQVFIRKGWPWAIVGNMFWEFHVPWTLKTSFVDFGKGYANCSRNKRLHSSSLTNSLYFFFSGIKSRWPGWPLPHFYIVLYIIARVFVLNMAEIQFVGRQTTINQSWQPAGDKMIPAVHHEYKWAIRNNLMRVFRYYRWREDEECEDYM